MILTGNDRFFSIGFDLPLPVIAALTGHAVAGGAILAIVCDYRIGKSGSFRKFL